MKKPNTAEWRLRTSQRFYLSRLKSKLIIKKRLYNEHYPSILVTSLGETEHFSGKNGALRWSILVGKQKHNVQKPS